MLSQIFSVAKPSIIINKRFLTPQYHTQVVTLRPYIRVLGGYLNFTSGQNDLLIDLFHHIQATEKSTSNVS